MDYSSYHTFAPYHEGITESEDTMWDQDDGPGITIEFRRFLDARINNRLQQDKMEERLPQMSESLIAMTQLEHEEINQFYRTD